MKPAIATFAVIAFWCIVSYTIYVRPYLDKRRRDQTSVSHKERKRRAKIDKAWAKTIRDAEAHLAIGTDYMTTTGLTVYTDELHDWILHQVAHHPGLNHDGYGCTWCADKTWQNCAQEETQNTSAGKRQPENVENVGGKTPDNVSGKTSGQNPGKTSGDIFGIQSGYVDRDFLAKLAEELSQKTPGPESAETPGGKPAEKPVGDFSEYMTKLGDALAGEWDTRKDGQTGRDENPAAGGGETSTLSTCPLLNPHTPHVPRGGHGWCPGDGWPQAPRAVPLAELPALWCGDRDEHPDHRWSNAGVDTWCKGTAQALSDDGYRCLTKNLGTGGWVLRPQTPGQNDILGVVGGEITDYTHCPQPIPHAAHTWPRQPHRFCNGLNNGHIPEEAIRNGYTTAIDCRKAFNHEPHHPHPHIHSRIMKDKKWCWGWTGPAPQ